jgi:TRAP-type C4-dicarboxylate transport system permease small subunit
MRKFLKRVLLIIGAVVVIAAIVPTSIGGVKVSNLASQAVHGSNALTFMLIGAIGALIGGLLLGISLATPAKGFKEQYEHKQAEVAAKAAQ